MHVNIYMDDVRPAPAGWMCVRTVAAMKDLLSQGVVGKLSLDHDMGACDECTKSGKHEGDCLTDETTFMNWCPHAEDGTKLVYWIIDTGNWPAEKPTVHSMNPVGRERMRGMIERYWDDRPTA